MFPFAGLGLEQVAAFSRAAREKNPMLKCCWTIDPGYLLGRNLHVATQHVLQRLPLPWCSFSEASSRLANVTMESPSPLYGTVADANQNQPQRSSLQMSVNIT